MRLNINRPKGTTVYMDSKLESFADGVHVDIETARFNCEAFGKAHDAALGRAVNRRPLLADPSGVGGDG